VEIVGREDEIATLHAFFDGAGEGPAAIVLEGDAGIGKSTLWLAGVEAARERSLRVLSARPAEAEQGLAHAALGDLLEACAAEVLPELSAPRRRALEAALLLDGDGDGSTADPRALSVAVHSALSALAERGPIVIAIDDVQWLDTSSADALSFALRRLDREPVRALLARRGRGEATALEQAFRGGIERLLVGPLSLGAIQGVVRDRLGRTFPCPTMLRLHEVSGSNPFYALELARALSAARAPLDPAKPLPVPESLERLVGDRVRALPKETRAALLVVAVVGTPAMELVEAAGIAAKTLAPAVATNVVELANGEVRFVHPPARVGVDRGGHGSRAPPRAPARRQRGRRSRQPRPPRRGGAGGAGRRDRELAGGRGGARALARRPVGRGGARRVGGAIHPCGPGGGSPPPRRARGEGSLGGGVGRARLRAGP